MPRLLIVCEYPTLLGGEQSMLATLPAVAAAGFEVVVAAPVAGQLTATLRERGVGHVEWRTHAIAQRLPPEQLRAELAAVARQVQSDLLHANSLSTSRIAGPVARDCGTRSIGHLRDILKLSRQAVEDLNLHTRLVAVSNATRDFHIAQGLDPAKCVVLHNGVDLTKFRPQPPSRYLHCALSLPSDARLIAVIGQLGLRKGTEIVLAAAHQIATSSPNVHWLIVGERTSNKTESREFEAQLHALAATLPLKGHVHFLGSRRDIPQLLCECELLVHAARQEPLGRVLLESAACGLAVIATNVGGTPEIFATDKPSAILVPPNDANALAEAVRSLLTDNQRRDALGAAARRRSESAFDIRLAAARLIELYHELLQ